jgi:uncharacterized SAM-binding protein YcdF (DUF218 family)
VTRVVTDLACGAIVVLGCALHQGRPSPALERRLDLAARAFRRGVAPRILATGGRAWAGRREADVMVERLRELTPEADLVAEDRSTSTAENARFSCAWLRQHGIERVMLATCHWHLPRALANFRRCGVVAIPPPSSWLERSKVGWLTIVKEHVSTVRDARLLATRNGLE